MAINDLHECVTCNFGLSQNQLNVTHWKVVAETGTGCTQQELADGMSTLWGVVYAPIMTSSLVYKGLKWRRLSPAPTASLVSVIGSAVGTLAGNPLPTQCSAVLTVRGASAPPKTRGRFYCPSPTAAQIDAFGKLTAAYLILLAGPQNFLVNFHVITGAGGTATLDGRIYHKKAPVADYAITSAIARPAFGTQRRRSEINRGDTSAV